MTYRPFAENDKFAIWRPGAGPASDIVLDKETGRWATGSSAHSISSPDVGSEDRQEAIMEMVRTLGLETADGEPALAPEGPSFGM